ncbi:MAG: glutamate-cysteine ligase family protein [Myxococcaceae bacterium]
MSLDSQQTDQRPISGLGDLVEYFRTGERSQHMVGLEHEKLLYPIGGSQPVAYPGGIEKVLAGFEKFGWAPVREAPDKPVIAASRGNATLSLEPGGQFELSGTPFHTAREAAEENAKHLAELKDVCASLGLRIVTLGYRPFDAVAQMPWMPKTRYTSMRKTLGSRGSLALDMMLMTATGQVSLDFSSEVDCGRKVTLVARATPVLVALFANSPLKLGQPSGYLTFRSRVWSDVDNARCGYQAFMLDGSFSYQRYAEWALDAPMLFLRRRGQYLTPPLTFRQFLEQGFEGERATREDWADHLSTMFPEVRVKKLIEVRGADCNDWPMTAGLVAMMRGLLYSPEAAAQAMKRLPSLGLDEHRALHESAQREGLEAPGMAALAVDLVAIAREGLKRLGDDDQSLLDALEKVAKSGKSPARKVLEAPRDPVKLLDAFTI